MTTSARRSSFAVASVAIVVAAIAVFRSAAYLQHPDVLAWAFTFDLTLTIPLMYYAFVVRPEIARPITMIPVFVICVAIARVLVPRDQQQFLRDLRFLTVPLEIVTLYLVVSGRRKGVIERVARSELQILRYGLFAWRTPDAPGFTVHKRNGWGTIVIGFIVAIVAESLAVHLLVQHWSVTAAWIVTGLDLYGILWLVGDYHALRLRVTTIEDGMLHLRYGMRWTADIPLANIAAVRPAPADWKRKGVLKIAMLDEPTLLVELHEPVMIEGLMGLRRTIDAIAILPDDDSMAAALTPAACPASTS